MVFFKNATDGFYQLPTLGYEISQEFTTALTNNQIIISLGQIVNTRMLLFFSFQNSLLDLFLLIYRILQWYTINSLYNCLWTCLYN